MGRFHILKFRGVFAENRISGQCVCIIAASGKDKRNTLKSPPKRKDAHQQQVVRLRRQVNMLRDQLRRSQQLAAVGTMTAMVAHEFNNILTPIINYAQLARMNPSIATKAVAKAADGGKRAAAICDALLGITSGRGGEASSENLLALTTQTVAAMAREPLKDSISLEISIPPRLEIVTRRVELQQVMLNLLMNARSAVMSKSGSRYIKISAVQTGQDIEITVYDNGIGIPKANLNKIFEPFFTTKQAGKDGGNGLGLAICRQILEGMGGTISVASTPGEGTTFTVRIKPEIPPAAKTVQAARYASAQGEPVRQAR
jgi:two-component system NtrC family sensor kinase